MAKALKYLTIISGPYKETKHIFTIKFKKLEGGTVLNPFINYILCSRVRFNNNGN